VEQNIFRAEFTLDALIGATHQILCPPTNSPTTEV